MIDQIINYNKTFVEQKGYERYITDKYPDKKLAVLSTLPCVGGNKMKCIAFTFVFVA